jgi:hypothetical protein
MCSGREARNGRRGAGTPRRWPSVTGQPSFGSSRAAKPRNVAMSQARHRGHLRLMVNARVCCQSKISMLTDARNSPPDACQCGVAFVDGNRRRPTLGTMRLRGATINYMPRDTMRGLVVRDSVRQRGWLGTMRGCYRSFVHTYWWGSAWRAILCRLERERDWSRPASA